MSPRFNRRMPGDPSLGDEILQGCCSLELKLVKFGDGELCLSYKLEGELLATGEIADAFCDDETNRDKVKAKRTVGELLAVLLDDEGRANA